jgi:hypothetical protein
MAIGLGCRGSGAVLGVPLLVTKVRAGAGRRRGGSYAQRSPRPLVFSADTAPLPLRLPDRATTGRAPLDPAPVAAGILACRRAGLSARRMNPHAAMNRMNSRGIPGLCSLMPGGRMPDATFPGAVSRGAPTGCRNHFWLARATRPATKTSAQHQESRYDPVASRLLFGTGIRKDWRNKPMVWNNHPRKWFYAVQRAKRLLHLPYSPANLWPRPRPFAFSRDFDSACPSRSSTFPALKNL